MIFISGRQTEVYEELNEIAPTVYFEVDGANYLDSVNNNMRILGQIFNKEEFIEEQLTNISSKIEEIRKSNRRGYKCSIVMANDAQSVPLARIQIWCYP